MAVFLGGFAILGAQLALLRHETFRTSLFDLGYYTQIIWNTAHGRLFLRSLQPSTFLGDHFSPVLALFAPVFRVLPDARVLLVVEIAALATAVVPAWLVLRARHRALAPLLVLAFVLSPLLHQFASVEFHEVVLAVPTLVLAIYGLERKRFRLLVLGLVLTLLVREDMAVYVGSLAVYLFVTEPKQRRLAALLFAGAVVWFVGLTTVVMPALGGTAYRHAALGGGAAEMAGGILSGLATRPWEVVTHFFDIQTARALVRIFLPFAGLPLLSWQQLAFWPALLMLLGYPDYLVRTLQGWHGAPLLPLLWWTVALFVGRLGRRAAALALAGLLTAAVVGFCLWSPWPGGGYFHSEDYTLTSHLRIGHEIAASLPSDLAIAVPNGMGAHLGARAEIHAFPWYDRTAPPERIVVDVKDPKPYPLSLTELETAMRELQMDPGLALVWERDGYYVFEPRDRAAVPRQGPWSWEPWLRLEGFDTAGEQENGTIATSAAGGIGPGRVLRVGLYWTALAKMGTDYSISVRLVAPDGRVVAQDDSWPARGLLSTPAMVAGQLIRDTHYLRLPAEALPEALDVLVIVYESATGKPIAPGAGQVIGSVKSLVR